VSAGSNKSHGDNNTAGCISVIWVRTIATGGSNTITWRWNNRGIRTIGAMWLETIGAVLSCDIVPDILLDPQTITTFFQSA
jgi:hypothetical protein